MVKSQTVLGEAEGGMHPQSCWHREGKHSQGTQGSPRGTSTATHFHASPAFLLLPFLLLTCFLLTAPGSAAELNLPGSSTVIYNRVTSELGTAQPPGTAKIAIKIRKSPWPEEFTLRTDGMAAG